MLDLLIKLEGLSQLQIINKQTEITVQDDLVYDKTMSSCLKKTNQLYSQLLNKDANWNKYLKKNKDMKHILDDFLNFSQSVQELQMNSKLDQIVFIEKQIKTIIDSMHNTKDFMKKLEKVKNISLKEEDYISELQSQRISKLKLRADAQTEEMEELIDVYKGVIELINAKIVRLV